MWQCELIIEDFVCIFQELEIDYSKYEHPPVLTVEEQVKISEKSFRFVNISYRMLKDGFIRLCFVYLTLQAKYVSSSEGALSKNLFLKVIFKAIHHY